MDTLFPSELPLWGIDPTLCRKHSSEILIHVDVTAWYYSTESQRCSMGTRSDNCWGSELVFKKPDYLTRWPPCEKQYPPHYYTISDSLNPTTITLFIPNSHIRILQTHQTRSHFSVFCQSGVVFCCSNPSNSRFSHSEMPSAQSKLAILLWPHCLLSLFQPFSVKSRDGWAWTPANQEFLKYSYQPVWHQQPCSLQSHWNQLSSPFWCSC